MLLEIITIIRKQTKTKNLSVHAILFSTPEGKNNYYMNIACQKGTETKSALEWLGEHLFQSDTCFSPVCSSWKETFKTSVCLESLRGKSNLTGGFGDTKCWTQRAERSLLRMVKGNKIKQSTFLGIFTVNSNQQEDDRLSGLKTKSLASLLLHRGTFFKQDTVDL